jgi:hypothetical protein
MRDLADEALEIVGRVEGGKFAPREDRTRLRAMVGEARTLLSDAGFPGEAAWRGLQRASIGLETAFEEPDESYWADVHQELQGAIDTLNSLVTVVRRDTDLRIVG